MSDSYSGNEQECVANSFVSSCSYGITAVAYDRPGQSAQTFKRTFDFFMSGILIATFAVPMVIIALAIKATSTGPVLYRSNRAGKHNQILRLPKFRTMRMGTPEVATRSLRNHRSYLTPIGGFLRRSSLDELPQLFSVLCGNMSLVGPRPVLLCEKDLIAMRTEIGVHTLSPGITGWAQVNGRDELTDEEKARYDQEYLFRQHFLFDLKILAVTVAKVLRSDGVFWPPQEGGQNESTSECDNPDT